MFDNLQELTGGKVTQTVAFQQQKNQLYGVHFLFAKFKWNVCGFFVDFF